MYTDVGEVINTPLLQLLHFEKDVYSCPTRARARHIRDFRLKLDDPALERPTYNDGIARLCVRIASLFTKETWLSNSIRAKFSWNNKQVEKNLGVLTHTERIYIV